MSVLCCVCGQEVTLWGPKFNCNAAFISRNAVIITTVELPQQCDELPHHAVCAGCWLNCVLSANEQHEGLVVSKPRPPLSGELGTVFVPKQGLLSVFVYIQSNIYTVPNTERFLLVEQLSQIIQV